jgi:hypothetical protein
MLYDALGDTPVGAVLDFSHVVASADDEVDAVRRFDGRIGHVHLRDAVLGDINLSIGRGKVDFPAAIDALSSSGYQGHYSLELETHDIEDADRATEAGRARSIHHLPTTALTRQLGGSHACVRQDRHHHRSRLKARHRTRHRACSGRGRWNIAILDLDEPSAKEAADEVAERQVQTLGVGCDVTDEASVEAALASLDGSVPPVGALVNNAGITSPTRFLEVTGEEWDRIFAVNVRGSYNVTRRSFLAWSTAVSVASCSCPRSQPSGAAGFSVLWRTRRPRGRSSGLPERLPENWGPTV